MLYERRVKVKLDLTLQQPFTNVVITLYASNSPEISIKNLRQPKILLNKQWKTLTKRFFALNFL